MTAAEIYQRVKRKWPRIAYGTVYNALSALEQSGQVVKLTFGSGASRYESRTERHDHAYCLRCGRLVDVVVYLPEETMQSAADQSGYRITGYHLELFGLCPSCQSLLGVQEHGHVPR